MCGVACVCVCEFVSGVYVVVCVSGCVCVCEWCLCGVACVYGWCACVGVCVCVCLFSVKSFQLIIKFKIQCVHQ